MRALLDVNVLIALPDPDHSLHERARDWFSRNAPSGWTSCPITQNGCVRIMAHPGQPERAADPSGHGAAPRGDAEPYHEFWADDVSLLEPHIADASRIHGPRQMTDLYLLALAVHRDGRFVTFDASVSVSAIKGADKRHILALWRAGRSTAEASGGRPDAREGQRARDAAGPCRVAILVIRLTQRARAAPLSSP